MKSRNTRNFILGTISQLSVDFNNFVIHLVELNTRIAERKQLAQRIYDLMNRGFVHPRDRSFDFGSTLSFPASTHVDDYLYDKVSFDIFNVYSKNRKNFSPKKIDACYVERYGPGHLGPFSKENEYALSDPMQGIIAYELTSEDDKIQSFYRHKAYCNRSIEMLLNNTEITVHVRSKYNTLKYYTEEEFFAFWDNDVKMCDCCSRHDVSAPNLFYINISEDVWKSFKGLIKSYRHLLDGTLTINKKSIIFKPK